MRKKLVGLLSLGVITGFSTLAVINMIGQNQMVGKAWNVMIEQTISKANALNSVTAIVFDFRGYDTFGEALVLFTAIFGVGAILRKQTTKKEGD